MHNVGGLAQRSERFIVAAWRAISEMHEEAVLRDALGAEAYEALARDQAELVKPKLGSVVDTPVAPAAAASAVAPPAAAAVAAAKSPGTTGDPDAKAAPPAAAATATATPQLSEAAERARRRFSFGGGGETCERCGKRVYPAEKAQGIKKIYHMECFRCSTCNTKLHPHSYELTEEGAPLCKVHHKQHLDATRRSSLCNSTPSIGGQFYLPDTTCVRCTCLARGPPEQQMRPFAPIPLHPRLGCRCAFAADAPPASGSASHAPPRPTRRALEQVASASSRRRCSAHRRTRAATATRSATTRAAFAAPSATAARSAPTTGWSTSIAASCCAEHTLSRDRMHGRRRGDAWHLAVCVCVRARARARACVQHRTERDCRGVRWVNTWRDLAFRYSTPPCVPSRHLE